MDTGALSPSSILKSPEDKSKTFVGVASGAGRNLDALFERVQKLQEDNGVLKQDIGVLKQDIGVLKQDIGVLKQDIGVLKQDNGVLGKYIWLTTYLKYCSEASYQASEQYFKTLEKLFSTRKPSEARFEKLVLAYNSPEWESVWSRHRKIGKILCEVIISVENEWNSFHPNAMGLKVVEVMAKFKEIREGRNRIHVVTKGNSLDILTCEDCL